MRVLVACEESQAVTSAFRERGHEATCLWLKGLPLLIPTNIVEGREPRIWKMAPSPDRAILRSKTYLGIAEAMASQWSSLV